MSKFKLDIQLFDGGQENWSAGITASTIDSAYATFAKQIENAEQSIMNYSAVDTALKAGWSGKDCEAYLDKFHAHAKEVCEEIETYKEAVKNEVENLKSNWDSFQNSLIS